ncbi:MAG: bacteriohemerythrin, partial [Peptostreptococcaceae bacterium]
WNDAFKTHIDILDKQHKELFRLLRDLEQMLLTKCVQYEYDDFVHTLCEIRDYVTYHFYTEEKYMEEIGYTELEIHQQLHEVFKKNINKINYDDLKQDPCRVIKDVKIQVEDYIMHHILIEDKKINKYKENKHK